MKVKELKRILDSLATDDTELWFSDSELYLSGIGLVDNKGKIRRESNAVVKLVSPYEMLETSHKLLVERIKDDDD